jgi:hypothetical protein
LHQVRHTPQLEVDERGLWDGLLIAQRHGSILNATACDSLAPEAVCTKALTIADVERHIYLYEYK